MGTLTLDARALIALLDERDAHHGQAMLAVVTAERDARRLVVAASALSETLVAPARIGRADDALAALDGMGIEVQPLDTEIALRAATWRASRPALRLPDALVLATAEHLGPSLLTYDERLGRLAP